MGMKSKCIDMIFRIATGNRRLRMLLTPIVGLSYLILAAISIAAALAVDSWLNLGPLLPIPLNRVVGGPVIAIGLWMVLWSQLHFFKAKGTPVPINPPPRLVVSGPYAHVRNPMLSGVFLLLFGIGLAMGSISLFFIFAPLFVLGNVAELKAIEEPELEMRLGQPYADYKRKTPMFFPSLRKFVARKQDHV